MTIVANPTIAIGSTVRMFDQDAHVVSIEHCLVDDEPITLVAVRPPFVFKNSIISRTASSNLTVIMAEDIELDF